MARMIDDVIELAREHLGPGIPLELVECDFGELAREAVEEVVGGHPHRDVVLSCDGDLVGFWDRDRVLQALSNVIGNAVQHGQDPIRVSVSERAGRQWVDTVITNAGRSPTKEEMATMFDPFRGRRGNGSGLGLGLYIVKAIARAHGALVRIGVGDDDNGFRFAIEWPRTPTDQMPHRGLMASIVQPDRP